MRTASLYLAGIPRKREPWPGSPPDREGPRILSDDPADHGLTEAEVACIRQAYEIRRRELRAAIEVRWERPLGGDWFFVGPRPTRLLDWVLWVVLVPIVNLLFIVMKLFEPIEWISDWRKHRRLRAALREELAALDGPPYLQPVAPRTLGAMWQLYGLDPERFAEEACVELLSGWIDRLYGPGMRQSVDLEGRLERISQRRAASLKDSPNIVCVLRIPRLEQVLRELALELPAYDWATRGDGAGGPTLH